MPQPDCFVLLKVKSVRIEAECILRKVTMELDKRKLFLLKSRSRIGPVCPTNVLDGLYPKTGALNLSPPELPLDNASSRSCACLSSGVDKTFQRVIIWLWPRQVSIYLEFWFLGKILRELEIHPPATARYRPSFENSQAHTAEFVSGGGLESLFGLGGRVSKESVMGVDGILIPRPDTVGGAPLSSWARKHLSNSLVLGFLLCERTLIYLGGSLNFEDQLNSTCENKCLASPRVYILHLRLSKRRMA